MTAVRKPKDLETSLKELRTLDAVLVLTIPLFIYAGEVIGPVKTKYATGIAVLIVLLTVFDIWSLLTWRRRKLRDAVRELRSRPEDAKAIMHWQFVSVTGLTSCESLALYGTAARIFGWTFLRVIPFYASALVLLLAFRPRCPLESGAANRIL